MKGSSSNSSFSILSALKNIGKQAKQVLNKINPTQQIAKDVKQLQNTSSQTLVNTNSNLPVNQSTLTNAGINQTTLNLSNEPQIILTSNLKLQTNLQAQNTPSQVEFQGPKDLPAYAGIANMSLKSWVHGKDSQSLTKTESGEKELTVTLLGVKGFQKQNYEGFHEEPEGNKGSIGLKLLKNTTKLLLLSHIFSSIERSGSQDTELLVHITNFKKLGSSLKEINLSSEQSVDIKMPPPLPNELQSLINIDPLQIKYIHQLLALPQEFPECLRLFAKDNIEVNPNELRTFLMQRLELVQGQLFGGDTFLNTVIANFVPLLNQNDYPLLLPLILLYYPLPPPMIKDKFDFVNEWKKKKKEKGEVSKHHVIATCEIYFISKTRGRFLLKFELSSDGKLSFDVQTSTENNGIVRDLELAIAESMYLLEHPPLLSDLNVFLTEEIYKATDIDEELSIVSTGPLRLEIILAVYASLLVLNKISQDLDPRGLIEMKDN